MGSGHSHALYLPGASPLHRARPQCKLAAAFLFVLAVVATPREAAWAFGVYALLLTGLARVAGLPLPTLARRLVIELPFLAFALFLPLVGQGERVEVLGLPLATEGLWGAWNIVAKGTLGVATSVLLAATTPMPELLSGLERLRLPAAFTTIAAFMVRYADVIADEVRRMRIARISRGHDPRWIWQARAVAASAGTLFIRSYERGERVYLAMLSRGYAGSMPVLQDLGATRGQWLAALCLPALEVEGVAFAYPDGHQALFGVSFRIGRGERVALLGPNGAGKTTLVLQCNGVLLPGAGRVAVAGLPVAPEHLKEIRRRVGIVFQDPDDQLFMPTVAEDVAFGPANLGLRGAELETRVKAALAAVGMEEHAGRPPHHLSFGQRRRVAVATVLAMEPDILILDEPSSNLDPASRRELAEILTGLDVTILMVTHDLPYALQLCPRALVMNRGTITADGPTAELLADAELLAANRLELPFGFDPAALRVR